MVTLIYEIRSDIWAAPSLRNLAAQKIKFRPNLGRLCDLIVNISGMQQDIVNWKTELQAIDTPAQADLIRCTLVHKQRKILPEF